MPIFEVMAPDGRKLRITAPEGATQEQALAYAQQQYQPVVPELDRLSKIEAALRAADAAGNTDDARRLAQAYVEERDASSSSPIIAEGPDGQRFEFPAATAEDVISTAIRKHYSEQAAPSVGSAGNGRSLAELKASSPAYAQMSDAEFATRVYRKYYAQHMAFPEFAQRVGLNQGGPNRADFSNVRGQANTVPALPKDYGRLRRDVPMGLRSTLRGVASIPDLLGAPIKYGIEKLTGVPQTSFTDMAEGLSDAMGLPRPETPRERVIGDVGQALSGTAATLGTGAALGPTSRLGRFLTAQPTAQVAGSATGATASGTARENGASPLTQMLFGLGGAAAPGGLPAATTGLTRLMLRGGEAGRQQMASTISDFLRAGDSPTLGQASPTWRSQAAEAVVRNAPGGAGVMRTRLESQASNIGQGVDRLAGRLSPVAGAEGGGRAIERGLDAFKRDAKATQSQLYSTLDNLIPADAAVDVSRTAAALKSLTTQLPGAPNLSPLFHNARITGIANAFMKDAVRPNAMQGLPPTASLSYDALRKLRTVVGQELEDAAFASDVPRSKWRALYGALSEDMRQAAEAAGPQARQAWSRANNYTRAMMERLDNVARVVDRNGGPEKVFQAAFSGTREGGTTLRQVMQSLDGQGQRDVAAAMLRRLGRAKPGAQDELGEVFSPDTFLTNWNRMAPEAKSALFSRFGPRFNSDLDAIARASARIRDASRTLANPSGTAPLGAQITAYGTIFGSLVAGHPSGALAVGAGMGAANSLARVFSSPAAVSWLAKQTTLPRSALSAQLPVLAQLAQDDEGAAALYQAITEGQLGTTVPAQR